ncbi:hypothetical protein BS47DRAFT_1292310, partial [Hydnum rufescens UP504]
VFSLSSETMTKRCNCIKPKLMEALQMPKFMLKKQWLNFTDSWETPIADMRDDKDDNTSVLQDILGAQGSELDQILERLGKE